MNKKKKKKKKTMNTELMEALDLLEKEKGISRDVLLDAIENSLMQACEKSLRSIFHRNNP